MFILLLQGGKPRVAAESGEEVIVCAILISDQKILFEDCSHHVQHAKYNLLKETS